ncbi:hypothetical protein ACWPM1_12900 [Tsuneonella sp. HG249]
MQSVDVSLAPELSDIYWAEMSGPLWMKRAASAAASLEAKTRHAKATHSIFVVLLYDLD